MILDRVTLTGADDSVRPEDLVPLTRKYPFVEWGILFSQSRQGNAAWPRYPSANWLARLHAVTVAEELPLSAHLCGGWVRDFVANTAPSWWSMYPAILYQRKQLNFHGTPQQLAAPIQATLKALPQAAAAFIGQADGVNDRWIREVGMSPLFDVSGGRGVTPLLWPRAWPGVYCGYAGGISPDNVLAMVTGPIADAAGDARVWIDMETHVRSGADRQFDLGKVARVLGLLADGVSIATGTPL